MHITTGFIANGSSLIEKSELFPKIFNQNPTMGELALKNLQGFQVSQAPLFSERSAQLLETLERELNVFQDALLGSTLLPTEHIQVYEERIDKLMQEVREVLRIDESILHKFGTKHANILKIALFVKKLNLKGVCVPVSKGIESDIIWAFIKAKKPIISEVWNNLNKQYISHVDPITPFLETKEAKDALHMIDSSIAEVFSESDSDKEHPLLPQEMLIWLEELQKTDSFLMIRSSGAEDSEETANAGGNVSKSYVSPWPKPYLEAAGKVIRSYFSESSLKNRINANLNPFDEKLEVSFIAHELIGEPIGGATRSDQIPISMTLFSCEPLYVNGEHFRIMTLCATYGHGEAVVGNKGISCDTAYLLISEAHPDKLYVLYDNQNKLERLAPITSDGRIALHKLENPKELRKRPALTPELLSRLYHLGIATEKIFNFGPVDMEIVIKNNILHPVQVRKVIRKPLDPTYIDLEKIGHSFPHSPIEMQLQTETLISGKGAVVASTSADHVLTSQLLKVAEKAYKKELHRQVIVWRQELINSHPFVNFSGLGIPCFVASNEKAVKGLLSRVTKENHLVTCVQTGMLYLWNSLKGEMELCISKGFTMHPAKIPLSLPITKTVELERNVQPFSFFEETKKLLLTIRGATTKQVAIGKINELKEQEWVKNLKSRKSTLNSVLQSHTFLPKGVKRAYEVLEALDIRIEKTFEEAKASWENKGLIERMRPLFHAKVLELTLFSRPKADGSLCQYSLIDVEPIYQAAMTLVDYQKELTHPAHLADLVHAGSHVLDNTVRQKWVAFLKSVESLIEGKQITHEQIQHLKTMVKTFKEVGVMTSWMTFEFSQIQDITPPLEKLSQVLETLPLQENEVIQFWTKQLHLTLSMKRRIDQFTNLKTFGGAWKELQNVITTFYPESGKFPFKDLLETNSTTTCCIALRAIHGAVDLFDSAIKAMKSNPNYSDEKKLELLKEMLSPYLTLLEKYVAHLVISSELILHELWPIEKYMQKMRSLLDEMSITDSNSLLPSENFSNPAALLGSGNNFQRHLPKTLEDLFTLVHQNLLTVLSHINSRQYNEALIEKAPLPPLIKAALTFMSKKDLGGKSIQRMGIDITADDVNVIYNVSLRNHSGKLIFYYNPEKEGLELKVLLLGDARRRWGTNKAIVTLLDNIGILPSSEPIYLGSQEVSFSWDIRNEIQLEIAIEEFAAMNKKSLIGRSIRRDPQVIEILERRKLLSEESSIQSLIEFAKKSFKTGDWVSSSGSLKVLMALVEKGQGYQLAAKLAAKGMNHSDLFVRRCALQLLEALVIQGKVSESIPKFAMQDIATITPQDQDTDLCLFSLDLCKALAYNALTVANGERKLPEKIQKSYEVLSATEVKSYKLHLITNFLANACSEMFPDETVPEQIQILLDLFNI